MKRNLLIFVLPAVLLILLLVGGVFLILHYEDLPENLSQHETIVLGQNEMVPRQQGCFAHHRTRWPGWRPA